jgi:hypothetical protein
MKQISEIEEKPFSSSLNICPEASGEIFFKNKNKNKNIYLSSLGMYKHQMGKQARYKIFDC